MLKYLSLSRGKILDQRPPLSADWVKELDIPDAATLRKVRRATAETYRVKKNTAERRRRCLLLRAMLVPYFTGR